MTEEEEMELRDEALMEHIGMLVAEIELLFNRIGDISHSNAFARCTALDIVKERIEDELESRKRA